MPKLKGEPCNKWPDVHQIYHMHIFNSSLTHVDVTFVLKHKIWLTLKNLKQQFDPQVNKLHVIIQKDK